MPLSPVPAVEDRAYETDTPLERLVTAELLLLSTTRLWLAAFFEPEEGHPSWREGLERARLHPGAAQAFDGFWRLVAAAPKRQLDLRCPTCPRLGEDEGALLQAVQALQGGRERGAEALLGSWLPPAGLRLAVQALALFAEALSAVGLVLPDRRVRPALPRGFQLSPCPDRGLGLVH